MSACRYLSRCFVVCCLAGLFCVPTASAVLNEALFFEQLSYPPDEYSQPVEFSDIGCCVVDYEKDFELEFLNVIALIPGLSVEPVWIVRNLMLGDITMGPPVEQTAVQFPLSELGVEAGMMVPEIQFGYEVRPDPVSDDEYPFWSQAVPLSYNAPVQQREVDFSFRGIWPESIDDLPGFPVYPHHPPYEGYPFSEVNSWIGCDMTNIPLDSGSDAWDDSACAPASCANSLDWLRNTHDEISFPHDARNAMKQLSNLMARMQNGGASAKDMARAKLDFIEAHNLPIHVKIQDWHSNGDISSSSGHSHATDAGGDTGGWPTEDWLFSESAAGEDVEMCVGYWYYHNGNWHRRGGHAVVVTGTGKVFDIPWVSWKHDADQDSAGGTEQKAGTLEDTGDGIRIRGMGSSIKPPGSTTAVPVDAYLESVVSESLDESVTPPPTEHTFGGYCEWFTRTIPPGGRLWITFPTDANRCMNLTLYREDRTVRPSKKVKMEVWNHNSGLVGEIHNTSTDKCRTIHIHNDDFTHDGNSFVPYTVGLAVQRDKRQKNRPNNPDEYGGFSLGGRDDSSAEFGEPGMPSVMVDPSIGCDLSTVPATLGAPGGTHELILQQMIPVWNVYWEELRLVVDVLEVVQPGDLFVECAATGLAEPIPIVAPGRYELDLGFMPPTPDFMLRLDAQVGLEMRFDALGVPSLVPEVTGVVPEQAPGSLYLAANFPNPFNPRTTISFGTPVAGPVDLSVYDLRGRFVDMVFNGALPAGRHEQVWRGTDSDGRAVPSGTYLVRLRAGAQTRTLRMSLVR